jgi:hypothetical protein
MFSLNSIIKEMHYLVICLVKKNKQIADVKPSSLAKGYDLGPPSLHPWQI